MVINLKKTKEIQFALEIVEIFEEELDIEISEQMKKNLLDEIEGFIYCNKDKLVKKRGFTHKRRNKGCKLI